MSTKVNGESAAVVPAPAAPVPNQGSSQERTWLHLFFDEFEQSPIRMPSGLVTVLSQYVGNVEGVVEFGPEDYRHHYQVYVRNAVLSEEAFRWWYSLDAITPVDEDGHPIYNWQTHYDFQYMPTTYRTSPELEEEIPMDLEHFDQLGTKPQAGHPSRFDVDTEALEQNKNQRVAQGYFVAMRKGVLFCRQTATRQRALMDKLNTETEYRMAAIQSAFGARYGLLSGTRYENLPHINHLSMLARNHLTKTLERILGDWTGAEKRMTYSRAEQSVTYGDNRYQVVVGGQSSLALDGSAPSGGLCVYDSGDYGDEYYGVAGLRKFLGHCL